MRSDLIIFLPPVRNQYLRLSQGGKDLPVEQFVSQFPVKRLYIAVLPGAAWFDDLCGTKKEGLDIPLVKISSPR